jgi:dUTP pyrophosphatase
LSEKVFVIEDGERIAQMIVAKHETIAWETSGELVSTERGSGGYGSTGIK